MPKKDAKNPKDQLGHAQLRARLYGVFIAIIALLLARGESHSQTTFFWVLASLLTLIGAYGARLFSGKGRRASAPI